MLHEPPVLRRALVIVLGHDPDISIYEHEKSKEIKYPCLDKKEMKRIKSDCEYLRKLVTRTDMNHVDDVEMGRMKEAYRQLQESAEKLETM